MPLTLLFDRSDRTRLSFSGPQAVATLNGLVTNDVAALAPNQGAYAAALTARGKMVADLRVFRRDYGFLTDTSALAAPGLQEMLTKYVNPHFATVTDLSDELGQLGVFGDMAAQMVATVTGSSAETLQALQNYEQVTVETPDGPAVIARVPDLGIPGYDLFVPETFTSQVYDALVAEGADPADAGIWDALRIAAGRPAWGVDMDETTLPQEANLDVLQAVSYTKGCYIGQETVARIHFRGHVNRNLRQLRIVGDLTPPPKTELADAQGKSVGDIRSTAKHTEHALIGLGMVRREIESGTTLTARWDGGEAEVHVIGSPPALAIDP